MCSFDSMKLGRILDADLTSETKHGPSTSLHIIFFGPPGWWRRMATIQGRASSDSPGVPGLRLGET